MTITPGLSSLGKVCYSTVLKINWCEEKEIKKVFNKLFFPIYFYVGSKIY